MDVVGLITLREELADDCRVLADAAAKSARHLTSQHEGRLEASAFELARSYNVIEQMALRVARSFENHVEKDRGWHEALLRRLTLEIPGIRPAFFPTDLRSQLDESRRFRHLVHHAYDLVLREDRIRELVSIAQSLATRLPSSCNDFAAKVASLNDWTLPDGS